jgi:hypothetical protein
MMNYEFVKRLRRWALRAIKNSELRITNGGAAAPLGAARN